MQAECQTKMQAAAQFIRRRVSPTVFLPRRMKGCRLRWGALTVHARGENVLNRHIFLPVRPSSMRNLWSGKMPCRTWGLNRFDALFGSYILLANDRSRGARGEEGVMLGVQERQSLRIALRPLLLEARDEDLRDNPAGARNPFFRPVSLVRADGMQLRGFSRDLSAHGIGLMHPVPLKQEEIEVSIATGRGYTVRVRARILWCRPCGAGAYVSGGQFVSVPAIGEL